ncbi:hypothetical protein DL96DRAFT_494026 [Flagelloscypha sp. PMI_526]|nr:hypothetical protein DL96DRAFT_494026 [Flagelloscypha sp. PMI_526]
MHAMPSPSHPSDTHIASSPKPDNPVTLTLPYTRPWLLLEATPLPTRSYNGVLQDITHNEYAASGSTLNFDFTDIYESSLSYASSVPRLHANAVATASYSSSSTKDALQQYTPSTSSAPSPISSQHVSQHPQIRVDQTAVRQVVQRTIFAATLQVQSLFASAVLQDVTSRSWTLPNQTHAGHDVATPLPLTSFLMHYPGTNIHIGVFFGQR